MLPRERKYLKQGIKYLKHGMNEYFIPEEGKLEKAHVTFPEKPS